MENTRLIFDNLVSMYADQQQAYNSIEEMFGTTGDISNIIDNTMARLENVIMLTLGWHMKDKAFDEFGSTDNVWVKGNRIIIADDLSGWFSIFNNSIKFNERMNIIFNMSMGDEEAFRRYKELLALWS